MVGKHKKKLKTYFLNMDLEKLMTSSWASGFPQFMTEILEHMDFEDLLKTRLVSTTFHDFLMNKNQRNIWIQAASKVFLKFFQSAYDIEKCPGVRNVFTQEWFTEKLKNSFQQEWIEVLGKIKETATISQIIKICHILKEIENPGKFCEEALMKLPLRTDSMIFEMSKMFVGQNDNLSEQILALHVTPRMLQCYYDYLRKKKKTAYSRVRNRRRAGNKHRAWKICQKE